MIDGLVSGRLYGAPQDRTAQNGKTFVTAKMRATRYVSNDTKSSPPKDQFIRRSEQRWSTLRQF